MRIAIVSASYAPEPTGIGPYSAELAESLVQRGHEVRVVTTFPYYPAWRPEVPRGTVIWKRELRGGVEVTRCRMYVPRTPRPIRRVLHELSWLVTASPVVCRHARWADACIVISPAFAGALLGAIVARLSRAPMHLHVQDLVPDIAVESGQLGSGVGMRLAMRVASWTYRSYRSVSVLSESMAARLRRYTNVAEVALIAPNWVRRAPAAGTQLPESLAGRSYALYAGSFGRKQDLALLAEAARLLSAREGPAIAVLGDGPGRGVLERVGDGIVWLGLVDEATYRTVLEHALAGIVALTPGVGDSVLPSKLTAYLGAGRPVVVAADADSEAARVVASGGCGVRIPPGRANLLADALCMLATDRNRWHVFAAAGRAYATAHWEKGMIVERIEAALLALRGS